MANKRISKSGVIQAAGGLLWRKSQHGRQIAVVHRSRYDDWALPKGWREKGESFLEAAVREVVEETNCRLDVGEFAGCSCYVVKSIPKIVLFWNMSLVADCSFIPNEEVDELVWLTVPEAMKRLSYSGERALLANAIGEEASMS